MQTLVFVWLEIFDLLYEVSLLVVELLVLGAVRVELGEEVDQLILIPEQDVQYWFRFVWIGYEYLKIEQWLSQTHSCNLNYWDRL